MSLKSILGRKLWGIPVALVGAILLAFGSGAGAAYAALKPAPNVVTHACIDGQNRVLEHNFLNSVPSCPNGFGVTIGGGSGTAGPAGPQGPSGVQHVTSASGNATLAAIGGSWVKGHTAVKAVTLPAGTYLVTLTGDFYKTATTTATPVLQIQLNGGSKQLTGYTGAFPYNSAEATGVGSDGTPNGLEQTAVADGIISVPSGGATLEIDAFGYNPDRGGEGGGDFAVNANVDIVQLTPAA